MQACIYLSWFKACSVYFSSFKSDYIDLSWYVSPRGHVIPIGTNTDCLFVHAKVFVFVLFFVWPILSMSLDCPFFINLIGGVMIRVFASSAVDRRFEPRSGQTRDYAIDLCCFSVFFGQLVYVLVCATAKVLFSYVFW
jgi:hypothetical protein